MRGDGCDYSHNNTPTINTLSSLSSLDPQNVTGSNTSKWGNSHPSKHRLKEKKYVSALPGRFAKNSSPHTMPQSTQITSPKSLAIRGPPQDSRSQIPCYHYARGSCRNGNACLYSHLARNEQEIQETSDPEVCHFQLYVTFPKLLIVLMHTRRTKTTIISHEISVARWPNSNAVPKCLKYPSLQISPLLE
jgi:hypothetical protein